MLRYKQRQQICRVTTRHIAGGSEEGYLEDKAPGPDEVNLEVILVLGDEGVLWVHRVMQAIWKEKRVPSRRKETYTSAVINEE